MMMCRFIITLVLTLFVSTSFAQIVDDFQSRIESMSRENRTIQCSFIQRKRVRNIKNIVESRGRYYYDNSGRMALRYSDPADDKIVVDGDKFTIEIAGKSIDGEAGDNPIMTQICNMLQACMSGDVTKLGRGWQTQVEEIGEEYRVTLLPEERRIRRFIESLVMLFDRSTMTLNELTLNDSAGGYTSYVFSDKIINGVIDTQKFE